MHIWRNLKFWFTTLNKLESRHFSCCSFKFRFAFYAVFLISIRHHSSCTLTCDLDLPVIFEFDLDSAKTDQLFSYLGQRSFSSNVIVRTHTHTHTDYSTWTTTVKKSSVTNEVQLVPSLYAVCRRWVIDAVHTSNNVETTFNFVEVTFDLVGRIVRLVAFDNVMLLPSTLLLVWTGL